MADKKKKTEKAVAEVTGREVVLKGRGGDATAHEPTEQNKLIVTYMAAAGRTQEEIARALKLGSEMTLRKYYRDELDEAFARMSKVVLGKLYQKILDGDTACLLFFCKTRLAMKETLGVDFPNGIPVAGDSSSVTDERTKQLIKEVFSEL